VDNFLLTQFLLTILLLRFDNWSSSVVNLNDLKNNIVSYLVQIGVISRFNQGSYEISECNLILYRLQRYIDIEKPYLKSCTYYCNLLLL
jgi:hypothetical protein